ncbi:hypothetical protein BpHYR1_000608 [Brachionus plicatilis]|uniref:Uncharacterized protein n=1 Tax=Brachionus plicatilis TaxID=10195 RepID=A0A3M7R6C9_BRAPC|nr:hypothetical protein BpHYR1_000608 [Brachionus plicatilis]
MLLSSLKFSFRRLPGRLRSEPEQVSSYRFSVEETHFGDTPNNLAISICFFSPLFNRPTICHFCGQGTFFYLFFAKLKIFCCEKRFSFQTYVLKWIKLLSFKIKKFREVWLEEKQSNKINLEKRKVSAFAAFHNTKKCGIELDIMSSETEISLFKTFIQPVWYGKLVIVNKEKDKMRKI